MSVVPEIKSPLEEKIVVKPILWTMYHIHAYQGPCRYGQGYALTTEADMEVAQKEYNRFLERIHEAVDPKKVEVLDGSLLHWNEDFVIHDNRLGINSIKAESKTGGFRSFAQLLSCLIRISRDAVS